MLYKRKEYFRHTFGTPLGAEFRLQMTDGTGKTYNLGECLLIDLSTGGARIYSKLEIPLQRDVVQLHLGFTLQALPINVDAIVVWKKPFKGGYTYGLEFTEDPEKERLILSELKLYRKSEVDELKKE